MISRLKKRWSDILIGIFLILMLLPQTRKPIQIQIQKLISFAPSTVDADERKTLSHYDLIFENEFGKTFNLNQDKGKVVLINFWATWCPPCIAEMPEFSALYKDYNDKVQFYFVTQDAWELIQKFESKRKYQLPYYKLTQPNPELDYTQLPTTYLIDKNGTIHVEKVGVADWNSKKFRKVLDALIE